MDREFNSRSLSKFYEQSETDTRQLFSRDTDVSVPRPFDGDRLLQDHVWGRGTGEPARCGWKVVHALLTIGGEMIIVEAEWPTLASRAPHQDGSSPVVIFVYVEDVDAAVERAVAAGAKILLPVKDQFWGDRTGRIIDPSGHVWTISTRIEETSSEEREERWSGIVKS